MKFQNVLKSLKWTFHKIVGTFRTFAPFDTYGYTSTPEYSAIISVY